MVKAPELYQWSSYRQHAWGSKAGLIEDHALYQQLGMSVEERQFVYREFFKLQIPDEDIHKIRECLVYNYPLGDSRFKLQIENALGRVIGYNQRGRPTVE